MQIRGAKLEDVPHVLPMVRQLARLHEAWDPTRYAYRTDLAAMYSSWLGERANDSHSVFLVADAGDKIIGFLVATIEKNIPVYQIERYGFIHDVWVEQDYRHEGIARQMTMLAVERFRSHGVQQIRLETAAANEAARSLFAACGFRASTTEMLLD
jgi:ribosomal protein S18 acetylase RimI-like enzyme